jgi:hypothetical protein
VAVVLLLFAIQLHRQLKRLDSLVRELERKQTAGWTVNAPHYVGDKDALKRALEEISRHRVHTVRNTTDRPEKVI